MKTENMCANCEKHELGYADEFITKVLKKPEHITIIEYVCKCGHKGIWVNE